jgi:TolA-binding protein
MLTLIRTLSLTGALLLCSLPVLAQELGAPEGDVSAPPVSEETAPPADLESSAILPLESSPPSPPESTESAPPEAALPEGEPPTGSTDQPVQASLPATSPTDADFQKGLSIYQKQDFATALPSLEAAVQSNPQSAEAYFYLGYALYKLKRFDESRLAFTQAYQLQPDYRPPLPPSK